MNVGDEVCCPLTQHTTCAGVEYLPTGPPRGGTLSTLLWDCPQWSCEFMDECTEMWQHRACNNEEGNTQHHMQPSEEEGEGGGVVVLSTEAFLEALTYASFHIAKHSQLNLAR